MEELKKLFLFLAVAALFTSGITAAVPVFADDDDDDDEGEDKKEKKSKKEKTLEGECAKKKPTSFDGLFCIAIFNLQSQIDDIVGGIVVNWVDIVGIPTDIADGDDVGLVAGDSFFDIFVEVSDIADQQCPPGQFATGTGIDGSLICSDVSALNTLQNQVDTILDQSCPQDQVVVGIDSSGNIICEPIPSSCVPTSFDEICDGIDNNCDGQVDEGFGIGQTCDGVGECGVGVIECKDANSSICSTDVGGSADESNTEICSDVTDNDCDGETDEVFLQDTCQIFPFSGGGQCASNGASCFINSQCPILNTGCVEAICPAGTTCDDGLFCTVNDACDGSGGISVACAGTPRSCDDADPNTIDSCDEQNDACLNSPDFSGTYAITPVNNYSCSVGILSSGTEVINLTLTQITINQDQNNQVAIIVDTFAVGDVTLTGIATPSGITATADGTPNSIANAIWQLNISFTDANTFSGTLSISDSVGWCSSANFAITGQK